MDTLVGATFSAQRRSLDHLVLNLVIDLVTATRSWELDEAVFDRLYLRLQQGLAQDTVRFIDFVPLLGFTASTSLAGEELVGQVVLRPMTDRELSHAVPRAAVPIDGYVATTAHQISRFYQWCLAVEHSHPLRTGHVDTPPLGPPMPVFGHVTPSLLAALRLVCGGSATTSRALRTRHSDDLAPGEGSSALLSPVGTTDLDRPTTLAGQELLAQIRTPTGSSTIPPPAPTGR
ncbi:hypothetical protein [Streptomyces sp.]|uniref:hypothetical protein n=1 Tax=Streptomyces sp. TaxID=1931 RepID=UPI002D7A01B7|nr:hypothetical protein [Streptomyces sp.]HET6353449.1 hypothetical protein [Streptomyces sp.]